MARDFWPEESVKPIRIRPASGKSGRSKAGQGASNKDASASVLKSQIDRRIKALHKRLDAIESHRRTVLAALRLAMAEKGMVFSDE
jgi:hypothetical protein